MFSSSRQHINMIITLAVFLTIAGALVLAMVQLTEANRQQASQLPMTMILNDTLDAGGAKDLTSRVRTLPFVQDAQYVDKATALKNYARQSGEQPLAVLDSNPLFNSIVVYTNKENEEHAKDNAGILKQLPGVDDVYYTQTYFSIINDTDIWLRRAFWVLIGTMAFLTLIILLTTTRLLLYADRIRIRTALLVGARPRYIAGLFIKNALLYGFIAGMVAVLVLFIALNTTLHYFPALEIVQNLRLTAFVCCGVVLTGIILPLLTTAWEVNRILRKGLEQLF